MPQTLIDNEVIDEDAFIKTYGTLQAVTKLKMENIEVWQKSIKGQRF